MSGTAAARMPAVERAGVTGRRAVVIGLGGSGLAAVRVLRRLGADVTVTEARPAAEVAAGIAEAEGLGAAVRTGGHAPEHLAGADLVITSPGVPQGAEVLRWASEADVPVWSEIELGARLAERPYVAVTGTNGKTTTTAMIAESMARGGLDAVACGNIGHPFTLAALEGHDALAVEVSSFQLRFHESLRPRVSVLLNLAPDHLDWHGGMEEYAAAKARVYLRQRDDDVHVGNRDDAAAAAVSARAPCRVVWFTLASPDEGEVGYRGDELVARVDGESRLGSPRVRTPGERADAAAAAAAALSFGLEADAVGEALRGFVSLPHRGAVVAEVDGVRFVDDSKATNPHAAVRAIEGWPGSVLIAGGRSKGVDLSPLAEAAGDLRAAVVLGEAADELVALLQGRVRVVRVSTLEDAVGEAHALARPSGTVLLAPACASQDMFVDYRERGERFAAAAHALGGDRRG